MPDPIDADLSVGAYKRIDDACTRFEKAWRSGGRPRIEDYLLPGPEGDELLRELLGLELELLHASGERPDRAAYERRFSNRTAAVGEAFDSFDAVVEGRAVQTAPADPTATIAPSKGKPRKTDGSGRNQSWRAVGFEVVRELGRGGMGVVYEARHTALGRTVALKTVLAGPASSSRALVRFLAEAEHVARLRHPNIVQVYEVGKHEGQPYIAFEYVEGGTLAQHLAAKPMRPREAVALVEQLARAVHHAHQQGIIHRDLKPANVLMAAGGPTGPVPKIADFGLARQVQAEAGLTGTGEVLGTPAYMAPEQARGEARRAGPPADIYALGTILYECLSGKPPFRGGSPIEVLYKVANEPPTPLVGAPADLEMIYLRCLRKDPRERYPTAEALADDLRRYLGSSREEAKPPRGPSRLATVLLMGTALLTSLGMGFAVWQGSASADAARTAEEKNEKLSEDLRKEEETRRAERRREARLALELGLAQCDPKDARRGLARLASALQLAHAGGAADLERIAAINLAEWSSPPAPFGAVLDHTGPVLAASVDADGVRTVTALGLHEWDDQGRSRHVRPLDGLTSPRCAAFSADGRSVAAAGGAGLGVWGGDGRRRGPVVAAGTVAALVLHRDGSRLLTLSEVTQEGLRRWDLTSDAPQPRAWDAPLPPTLCATFSPSGGLVLAGGNDRTARVLDAATGRVAPPEWRHDAAVTAVAVAADGRAATGTEDGFIQVWDLESRKALGAPFGGGSRIVALGFSGDGKTLLSGSGDGSARFWDAKTGLALGPPRTHKGAVTVVAFGGDGRTALTGSVDGAARRWQVPTDPPRGSADDVAAGVRRRTGLDVGPDGRLRPVE